jgi:hypothetical protein
MTSHKIQHIDLQLLQEHIKSKISTSSNTITIYHFIIGSKAYENDFALDSLLQSDRPRNHECPKIVENLLFNPDLQLSPDILSNDLKQYKDITIRQILILIDPAYVAKPLPVGLLSVIDGLPLDLTIEHNLENINIKSILEPIIVPCDITEAHVIEMIKILSIFKSMYPILINIMDCSSNTCTNIYANSISYIGGYGVGNGVGNTSISSIINCIHITKPKCLIDDTELQYIPIITFCKDGIERDTNSLFTDNKLNIRWVNCKDDLEIIDKTISFTVYSNCIYSKNLHNYITRLYKVETFEYSLFLIQKLWGVTTYTSNHIINYKVIINRFESNKEITINFSKLSFEDFAKYWKCQEFKELAPFNYDYDFIIFCKFIDNFINKYSNGVGYSYIGLNPSIVDFLKVEAHEIFIKLAKYFHRDSKYLTDDYKTVSRDTIKKYLIENNVNL